MPLSHEPYLEEAITYFAPESQPVLREAIRQALEKGVPYDLELELITSAGKRIWTHTIGKAVYRDGKIVKIQGMFQDIDAQKRAERELKKKLTDLEKFNKFAVGRELRMMELKNRVKELEEKLGER